MMPLNMNPVKIARCGPSHDFSGRKRKRCVKSRNAVFHLRPQNSLTLTEASGRFMIGRAKILWSSEIQRATPQKSALPARSFIAANPHSPNGGRSSLCSRSELRKDWAFNPGQASKYPACCHHCAPGEGVRRQVNHLQPTRITKASNHMKTQRGHDAGVNMRTATGKIMTGPQPRHAVTGCGASFGSIFFMH